MNELNEKELQALQQSVNYMIQNNPDQLCDMIQKIMDVFIAKFEGEISMKDFEGKNPLEVMIEFLKKKREEV